MNKNNSILHDVQELFRAIYLDLTALHPSISTDLERDLTRLVSTSDQLGLKFFTIALPTACKWFDKSLSVGRLLETRPPHFGVKAKSDKRPAFMHGLFSGIFEPDGTLRSDADISMIASTRQVLLAVKKLKMECEERYTHDCVQTFHEIEESLPHPWASTFSSDTASWCDRSGHPIWGDCDEQHSEVSMPHSAHALLQLDSQYHWRGLSRFSARILHGIGPFDPYQVRTKHGPGAVSDKTGRFVKYDFLNWTERLECVFPYDWHASNNLSVPDYVKYEEFASKMCAVPKTQSGPRLIAAEPTAHQWIQQGIRHWLEQRITVTPLRGSIDFRSQEPSREAALRASASGDMVTVDLSSASDRLTCRLVEFLFQSRPDLLDALHACRTRYLVSLNGERIVLRKFATQGSAVIFPLQSIVYAMLAAWSVCIVNNRMTEDYYAWACRQVRVYGDDIIVPKNAYTVLAGLLETCLLKVNESKTHTSGFFRESCGMDAFKGVDVTPAYLRAAYSSAPDALESVIQCSNNFFKKGLWRTAEHLLSTLPEKERKLLPIGEGIGSTALYSFCGMSLDHLQKRWNSNIHVFEYRTLMVTTKVTMVHGSGNGPLSQFFFEEPDPDHPYQSGQVGRARSRKTTGWVSPA